MWRYTTFPSKAGPALCYPSKDGYVLSGSVPETNTKALIKFFAGFEKPGGDGLVHFTLSLPAGRQLSEEQWHEVVRHVLQESGLPPDIVPWVVWGGEQTNCDHVHIIAARQTFTGRSLEVATSVAFTQKLARDLCHRLSLPEPDWMPDPEMCLVMPIPKRRQRKNAAAFQFATDVNAVMGRFRPETLDMLNRGLRRIKSPWQIDICAQNAGYLIPEHAETGRRINPRDAGSAFSSKNILRRLAFATRLRLARTALFLRRIRQHIGNKALPEISSIEGYIDDRTELEPQNHTRKTGSDTGGHPEVAAHPDAPRHRGTGEGPRFCRPPVQSPTEPYREGRPAGTSTGTAQWAVNRDDGLPENSYGRGDAGRGIWFFRLKRLAKDAGLKATQKFSPDYSSILLQDETGRQGRFDLVQRTAEPGEQEWDGRWYALASRFQELFNWDVPSRSMDDEGPTFDPF